MFHMKPIAPTLRLTTTVLLARQVNRLTLISMAGVRALDLQVEPLPEQSGHALVAEFVAGLGRYPAAVGCWRRSRPRSGTAAARPVDPIFGKGTAWLARAVAGVTILFAIWFLFSCRWRPTGSLCLRASARAGPGRWLALAGAN